MPVENVENLVIVGSGPAGYTAAIYAARANLAPVLFEGFTSGGIPGGQLMTTTEVENYPGFPKGVTGPELMDYMRAQAERFSTRLIAEDVVSVDLSKRPFFIEGSRTKIQTQAIIIATGATAKRLDIPGTHDGEFWQKGVSACAVCDGASPVFRGKDLFVIGGGDSACEEALFLTKFGSRVFLVHRRDTLRASKIMADRVMGHPKITVLWDSVITKVEGTNLVNKVLIENLKTHQTQEMPAAGVFFAIGHTPNTAFLKGQLPLDPAGYLQVTPGTSITPIPGVFAAGDVQDHVYRQAVTAAGSGCMAALDSERWLAFQGLI